ncbi:AbrB/MazE/SpoVT family DNA-binding domain-containing protein [Aureimonas ureilytica]|uniref:AbrB/MazE/SpoVT family DNA-binding domain-containing protein n=1 Tax=Aureimonas ureilytica TaxID=401562 RepID=UPI0009DC46F8|nr:AbrB/MazE/SpoVT family DNA-binding domain-containing protein [Aureimonas ureilytica]
MSATKGKIVEGGRVILPAAFRKAMGVTKGDTVIIELHGEEVRIRPAKVALRRLQDKLRAYGSSTQDATDLNDEGDDTNRSED